MSPASRVISRIGSLISSCLKFPKAQLTKYKLPLHSKSSLQLSVDGGMHAQSNSNSIIIVCLPLENLGKTSFSFLQK